MKIFIIKLDYSTEYYHDVELSLRYKRKAWAKRFARAISMRKISTKIVEALKIKEKRAKTAPKTAPKGCEKRVFRAFSTEYLFKYTKKSGIYAFILHNYPILVRSTGIEDIRRYEKSLDFQGFFAIECQSGRQKF